MTNNECKGLFEGLLVIDMTHVLNGPFGTQLLCNMGARVIKVEPPGHGDDTRTFGPYVDGQSLYYSFINHGKESVVLDLKNDHDKSIFINMLKQADVLAENFRQYNGKTGVFMGNATRNQPASHICFIVRFWAYRPAKRCSSLRYHHSGNERDNDGNRVP